MTEHDSNANAREQARQALAAPAIIILVLSVLSALVNVIGLFMSPMAFIDESMHSELEMMGAFAGNVFFSLLWIAVAAFTAYGAWEMRNVKSYGLSMAAAIASCIPCVSVCCPLGIPFGIWALVLLMKPEIKAGFDAS